MAINPTYPGVYVQEIPSGNRAIAGVSTSTALFIGQSKEGPLNRPVLCTSYEEFVRAFGDDRAAGELATYVRLFYLNGGGRCYVMRIADGADFATVQLLTRDGGAKGEAAFSLRAKSVGSSGEQIRTVIRHGGRGRGSRFRLKVFKWKPMPDGGESLTDVEEFKRLSMNPNSDRYAPTVINQKSKLVEVIVDDEVDHPIAEIENDAVSVSGRPFAFGGTAAPLDELFPKEEDGEFRGEFQIRVGDKGPVTVVVQPTEETLKTEPADLSDPGDPPDLIEALADAIHTAFENDGYDIDGDDLNVRLVEGGTLSPSEQLFHIELFSSTEADIAVTPSRKREFDLALLLMMGEEQGGIEVGRYAQSRPVPTGVFFDPDDEESRNELLQDFADFDLSNVEKLRVSSRTPAGTVKTHRIDVREFGELGQGKVWKNSDNGHDGVLQTLSEIAGIINNYQSAKRREFFVRARLDGYRLYLEPTMGPATFEGTLELELSNPSPDPIPFPMAVHSNVRFYSVGAGGRNKGFQASAAEAATDGRPPKLAQYERALAIADEEIDLFNLVVLPPREEENENLADQIYGTVSALCEEQRAFLLMDPPEDWKDVQSASQGVDDLRIGLVNDYSAVFYPKIRIVDGDVEREVGPAGAIAGLIARIDSSRGIWKAPAGVEAGLRGVVGLSTNLSDTQNGVLNERGINSLRVFPNGVVNWGARTMDGDDDFASEWKYIPVRRLALFIQESLYRGLQWAVFEPNGQQLWGQIRATVGAFMHRLYRQGAFGGESAGDAYFVQCDSTTTPPSDQALGIVNVRVGFRPVYPAEFVILTLQQKTAET